MADTRAELIARLEKTAGPNLELESAIYFETAASDHIKAFHARQPGGQSFTQTLAALGIVPPRYTSSLDAAMTLVPKGSNWRCGRHGQAGTADVRANTHDALKYWREVADGATPALALCIASLNAGTALRAAVEAEFHQRGVRGVRVIPGTFTYSIPASKPKKRKAER